MKANTMKALWKIWVTSLLLVSVVGWGQTTAPTPKQTPAPTQTPTPGQSSTPAADPLVGDWQGNITPDLPVVIHITLNKGAYVALTDSPNQGVTDIPTTVAVDGNTIRIRTVAAQPSRFTGTIDGDTITGMLVEGSITVPFTLTRSIPEDVPLAGDWQGSGGSVRVVLHVAESPTGYSATADNPSQGISGLRAAIVVNGAAVRLQIAANPPATFVGTQTGSTLTGTFTQGRNSTPMTFTKTADATASVVVGDWQGNITELVPITLHIRATGRGYTAITDSPTLGKTNVRAQITVNGNTVRLRFAGAPVTIFTGRADGNTLTGNLTTGSNATPFTFARMAK